MSFRLSLYVGAVTLGTPVEPFGPVLHLHHIQERQPTVASVVVAFIDVGTLATLYHDNILLTSCRSTR